MKVLSSFYNFEFYYISCSLLRREENRFELIERLSSYLRLNNITKLTILENNSFLVAIDSSSLSIRLLF